MRATTSGSGTRTASTWPATSSTAATPQRACPPGSPTNSRTSWMSGPAHRRPAGGGCKRPVGAPSRVLPTSARRPPAGAGPHRPKSPARPGPHGQPRPRPGSVRRPSRSGLTPAPNGDSTSTTSRTRRCASRPCRWWALTGKRSARPWGRPCADGMPTQRSPPGSVWPPNTAVTSTRATTPTRSHHTCSACSTGSVPPRST